jgi:hypothetical protein
MASGMAFLERDKADYQLWDEEAFQSDIDVRTMTWLEKYIYKGLLTNAWTYSTRPDLPTDPNVLWKLAGCKDKQMWEENCSVPLEKFSKENREDQEVYYQNRLRKDWSKLVEKRESLSQRGKAGGNTRWNGKIFGTVKPKELNPFKMIPEYCYTAFGRGPEAERYFKRSLDELIETYGGTAVSTAFEIWANTQTLTPNYPVGDFIKVAHTYLKHEVIREDPGLDALCTSLYHIGGEPFTGKKREILNLLLTEFSFLEIEKAYKDFITTRDEFSLKYATRDFTEGGGKTIILANRESKEKEIKQEEFLKRANEDAQASVQHRLAQLAEKELIEERL